MFGTLDGSYACASSQAYSLNSFKIGFFLCDVKELATYACTLVSTADILFECVCVFAVC